MHSAYQGYLLLMATVLLTGCASPIRIPPTIPVTSPVAITSTPTHLPSATVQPTSTLTSLPPENILKYQPFEITTDLPSDVKPGGALVIWSTPLQLLHFGPSVKLEAIPGVGDNEGCLSTSPDGKWLSHCQFSSGSNRELLIVQSADGRQKTKVLLKKDLIWFFGDYLWLDNQRLIFPLHDEEHQLAYPMVTVNPFTGEQVLLESNYPDLQTSPMGPAGTMDFNIADIIYDPSLDLVFYPSWGKTSDFILWNRRSKAVVAEVKDKALGGGYYPLWSPDGTQLAIQGNDQQYQLYKPDEWFIISREGHVEQLTHFQDYFTKSQIGYFAKWSPDGKKLAFWLDTTPSLCPGSRLAILDVVTKQVINTCIPGASDFVIPPVWSLNSRYIIANNASQRPTQIFLVDVEQDRAFDITKIMPIPNSGQIGWLVSP